MARQEGHNYAPEGKPNPVVKEGEFVFSAAYFDHGHIYGQTNGLLEAGGTIRWAYDPDPARLAQFCERYPKAQPADSFERILEDPGVHLVTSAAVPNERGPIGLRVLDAGKDYFTDKCPFTTLDQLAAARRKVADTGRKFLVYYSERLHNEAAFHAGELVRGGAIGDVVQVLILAPHRLSKDQRPAWFFEKERYGGILTDIGSHQFEQFLYFTGARDATVNYARVANLSCPEKPELEDFGEAQLQLDTGASCYCRVDWLTPDGLRVWGDGRAFVLGTRGYVEVRKYIDIAREGAQRVYLVDGEGEKLIECEGRVGYPFFGQMILDVLGRTERAMTQEHVFKAAELSMLAQERADRERAASGAVL